MGIDNVYTFSETLSYCLDVIVTLLITARFIYNRLVSELDGHTLDESVHFGFYESLELYQMGGLGYEAAFFFHWNKRTAVECVGHYVIGNRRVNKDYLLLALIGFPTASPASVCFGH